MRRSLTLNLHQHARRILAHSSNRTRFLSSFTNETLPSSSNQILQSRIESALDRKSEISSFLELWRREQQGNQPNPTFLRGIVLNLRESKRFRKALAVSDWMMEQKMYNPKDFTARFHLIENVHGFEEAEKFFENVPENLRDESLYTALLSRYVESGKKTLSKAESTFEKMRELGLITKNLSPYNSITSIYGSMVMRGKVDEILKEMKEKNIEVDSVTVNNVLRVYDSVSEIASMDKFQLRITLDMARAYLRIGSKEKAREMLCKTEEFKDPEAYEELIRLYGEAGRREDVYRIWKLYKETRKQDNKGFRALIGSLLELGDYKRVEMYYKEWECSGLEFDIRIPKMLASCYREMGMVNKADQVMRKTIRKRELVTPITPLLEELEFKPFELRELIKNLRDSNQFSKALEVSSWMYDKGVVNLYPEDYAARLDLIERKFGLEEAEKFFETSIPENMKDYSVYATLLDLYTRSSKTLSKAEATFEKMRELGFLDKLSPFKSMISFYTELRKRSKVNNLLCEMKENNIEIDSVTKNNVLRVNAYVSAVESMEKYMSKWVGVEEGDEKLKLEVKTRDAMAEVYKRVGLTLKAIEITPSRKEVDRLWNLYKRATKGKMGNEGYLSVIRSLLKFEDVKGAEQVYQEWESSEETEFDARIPGLLISRYCKEDDQVKLCEVLNSSRVKLHRNQKIKMLVRFWKGAE